MFSYDADDRRRSFRVRPTSAEPIGIKFQGKSALVKDIGGGGLSFSNKGFKVGDTQAVTLDLPGKENPIHVTVEIIDIDEQDVCHGRFTVSSHDAINAIHRYMLAVQKDSLRMKRRTARREARSQTIAGPAKDDRGSTREADVAGTSKLSIPGSFSVD
jgi:hypothetical protein